MLRALRILLGLLAASITAALLLVLHLLRPMELVGLPIDILLPRLLAFAQLTALAATQIAMFIVPFGVILAPVAEMNRWRSAIFYSVLGLVLAAAGYMLQYQSEDEWRTVVNMFAAQVFALQGLTGGLAYWFVAGRFAGWRSGGGPLRADPIPIARPKLLVSDAVEPTVVPALPQVQPVTPAKPPATAPGSAAAVSPAQKRSSGSVPSAGRSSTT